ncbi:trimeric intracellular cation channel family protein [Halovulum dunhuangense]|uniref:Trimeric intracellular cation channel family protein n=1 Tax=Halovulum dunhuangense TaxID=1505036 RepID=A0A849L3R6_9RHOB|nr:trimeric intracellular cation channel family protein [Halovulum dunhuangense]NNU80893.1 trimeric intracellular cation channel family protein [Halovulum dunhuangense]
MGVVEFFDYAGVALFAATGALAASRKQLDIIGFIFLAAVTGMGGGTVRDLVLDVPVFWVDRPVYVLVCMGVAVLLYFTAHLAESRYRWLLWLDAAALAAYGVFGAYKGLLVSGTPIVAVVMGMLTGTLGGILRDVLANEPSVLLRREIYVTAALTGAGVFVAVDAVGAGMALAACLGFGAAFALRGLALVFDWRLPTYRARKGRHPDRI